jgi:hypothetical protein
VKLAGSGRIGARHCPPPSGYRSGSTTAVLAVIPQRPSNPYLSGHSVLVRIALDPRPDWRGLPPPLRWEYIDSAFVMHPNAPIQLSDLPWPQGRAERRAGASLIRDNSPASTGPALPVLGAYQRRLVDGLRARGARERPARPRRRRPASRQRSVSAAVSREGRELFAELARINTAMASLALRIMEGSGQRCRAGVLCPASHCGGRTIAAAGQWDEWRRH